MIELQNIKKRFGEKEVLKGIDAKFVPGKINMVIGGSGSGKTVLLKCIVGLMVPDEGKLLYDGRDFLKLKYNQQKKLRQELGVLFQYSALFDSMTVEENVAFPLRFFTDRSDEEIMERVNFCLGRVNLENVNKLYPDAISGGMKKRVGIARAIVLNPKYLFCDEPTSGLDPITASVIDSLIAEITEEFQTTTVINTHDMKSVQEYGDNIIFLYKGLKYWEGNKDEIKNSTNERLNEFIDASEYKPPVKN
jgi:phospholipid/cholesterol/gamma-HCH transport system ATP-binding protein